MSCVLPPSIHANSAFTETVQFYNDNQTQIKDFGYNNINNRIDKSYTWTHLMHCLQPSYYLQLFPPMHHFSNFWDA